MFESQVVSGRVVAPDAEGVAAATIARLEGLVAGASALGAPLRESGSWAGSDRARALRALDRLTGVLAAARSGLLVAEQRAETSLRPGDRDFTSALARVTRTGLGDARREVRQAETLVALPAMAEAVSEGRIPLPHVDALARVAANAGEDATATLGRPDVAERLVGLAQRLPVKEFSASAARLLAAADPASLERSAEAQRRERFLILSHQPEGTFLRGRLDRLSAQTLQVALASVRQAPDENRDKSQADADALVALAERAMSGMAGVRPRREAGSGEPLPDAEQDAADAQVSGVANRPTVSVLVPAETFAELREAELKRSSGGGDQRSGPDEAGSVREPGTRSPSASPATRSPSASPARRSPSASPARRGCSGNASGRSLVGARSSRRRWTTARRWRCRSSRVSCATARSAAS